LYGEEELTFSLTPFSLPYLNPFLHVGLEIVFPKFGLRKPDQSLCCFSVGLAFINEFGGLFKIA
jgi:hypothetical protein